MPMRVLVVPPDPNWPQQFDAAAAELAPVTDGLSGRLQHIGSTSIPGIHAKPVIDMLLEVPDLAALDAATPAIEALGYVAMGEYGIPGRRYFRRDTAAGERSHHLHAFLAGSDGARRHLAFRDWMRAHPEHAAAYSALKQRLAAATDDIEVYMDGKDAFVKHHEALALAAASP